MRKHPIGFNNLGLCYERCEGVEKNYSKSIEYYNKAIELGNSSAKSNLDLLLRKIKEESK